MILVGELSLWVALLMAAWAATVSFAGGQMRRADLIESGERAIYATLAMVVLASIGLWTALLTHDFSIKYVASFTSANLPKVYTITAFWGGQSGSLLFWALILSIYSAITLWTNRTRNRELMPYVSGTLALILVFFLATICLGSNPFERLDWIPPDGRGLNPQLQNPGMAIHPPNLYLGYVGTSIPFAFAIAALLTRRLDAEWLAAVRRWALLAWFFNTVGIVLGMWWAYVELGWGGYWAWDPVENASLLPWLVNTAFLHSIMVQEKRGMLRKWNVTLVVSAFLLSIFGTFITRSGVISSVHSFAQSPVGKWFAVFLVVAIAVTGVSRLDALERSQIQRPAGEHDQSRGGVSLQQSGPGWNRVLGAVGNALPHHQRSRARQQDHRRSAVLQHREHSAWIVAVAAHRHRPVDRLATGVGGKSQAAVHHPCRPPPSLSGCSFSRWACTTCRRFFLIRSAHSSSPR